MTSREFCYWLQGYFEIADERGGLNAKKLETVKRHLALVFKHEIDPSYPETEALDAIHSPTAVVEDPLPVTKKTVWPPGTEHMNPDHPASKGNPRC